MANHDVLIIGMGIGALAIARQLVAAGADVAMMPGAARPRFPQLDAGVVHPEVLTQAYGDVATAPLSQLVDQLVFRRDKLEAWARQQLGGTIHVYDTWDEAQAVPHSGGGATVIDSTGERSISARHLLQTEGANPKISIALGLRRDFPPDDLIHFGRSLVIGARLDRPFTGAFRTSWQMPAWYSAVPLPTGVMLGASARLENLMRANRDARDVLRDFVYTDIARRLGIDRLDSAPGMELVPLHPQPEALPWRVGAIAIAPDANGAIDARAIDRYDQVLRAAIIIGRKFPSTAEHDLESMFSLPPTPYHDSSESGFLEEGPADRHGILSRWMHRRRSR